MKHKKIGILGGTFNPIHIGHLVIAEQALAQLQLDKVYFMPDFIPPHIDAKTAIAAKDRVNMISLAIENNAQFGIEMNEIKRGGKSYSYDTMINLKKAHPMNEYYFIIGGDMVSYLPKWYRIKDLLSLVTFVGVNRQGNSHMSKYPVKWIKVPTIAISSTFIRDSIKNHKNIRYLVPDKVLIYIKEHHLYE